MEKTKYVCLACGHEFYVRKEDEKLSKPRQCGQCWSYDVFPESEIEELVKLTKERIEKRPLAMLPLLDATETVIKTRGIRLTPISTIRLIRKVYREVTREA